MRDFRIDAEKLKQRMAKLDGNEENEDPEEATQPLRKRNRATANS